MTVEQAITRSQAAFASIVWPRLAELLGDGQLIPVETVTDSTMTRVLDMLAGVDTWLVRAGDVYPVASRVQYGPTAWRTHTVRRRLVSGAATEYDKRLRAIRKGALYPSLTIQAYIDGDRLLAAAAVDTRHLMDKCQELEHQIRRNPADGSEFIFVGWDQCSPDLIHIVDNTGGE